MTKRHGLLTIALLALVALIGAALTAMAAVPSLGERPVVVLRIEGVIGPATSDFIHRELEKARTRNARLVVLQMDTPGGLDTSMRAIIKDILASPVPVATFVAPEGARAASAGTYILYASHIAAMAPATNLGAATPVAIGMPSGTPGKPSPAPQKAPEAGDKQKKDKDAPATEEAAPADPMMAKAVNDAAAYIRSLAQLRGRNADFAERAVRRASSLSATEALNGGVIDVIAADMPELLKKIDGREIEIANAKAKLDVSGAAVEHIEPDWRNKLLALFSNPMFAVMLMMIGVYGLFVEFTTPGFGVPGVAGAISLLLGLYALQLLPVNWVGAGLLLLGLTLMIAEVFLPSFGALGVGGIIAFVFGGLMLIDTEAPGFGLPLGAVVGMALVSAAVIIGFGAFAMRARRRPVVSGREELVDSVATVETVAAGVAWVRLRGELWQARAQTQPAPARELQAGERVRVTALDGLTLIVQTLDRQSDNHQRSAP